MSVSGRQATIDGLVDRAIAAVNRGDQATARELAGQVLAVDSTNTEVEELLAAPMEDGELRRLTIMFADLVDSTALSTQIEPEIYRTVVGRYREEVSRAVNQCGGHIGNTKGDGLLAVFGHPHAHEDDVRRAAQAGLDITRAIASLSERVQRRFGFEISVRVGIHRGLVYLDTAQDDIYGFAANLAARMCSVAAPGTVAVSDAVAGLIRTSFELQADAARSVKGVEGDVIPYRIVGEREMMTTAQLGPLVGRQAELSLLESRWDEASAGSLATAGVMFCGEAGIGKSRVARASLNLADAADAPTLELVGSPFHTDVGMHPIRKLLERRCHINRTSEPAERLQRLRDEIAARGLSVDAILPLLAPVLGITPEHHYTPVPAEGHKLAERINGAITEYLIACTEGGPGLLLVEDMHWFDAATLGVVHALLRANLGTLLVVITSRDAELLQDDSLVTTIELKPLSADDTERLILALHPDSTSAERKAVRRRCDGVPLYIEEVVAKVKQHPATSESDEQVPDSLYEALFARLRSSESALRFVEAAATIGNHFDRALVRSVTRMSDDEMDGVITELEDGRVLQPVSDDVWRFRHELLREVAAELPPPSIRRKLHGRVADALIVDAERSDPDWAMIAHHFQKARRFDGAVSAHQQASATARRRGALNEARNHLASALEQLSHLPPGQARDHREVNLRLHRGFLTAAAEGSGSSDTAADFERCLQLSGTDPHADELFATLMALFSYYVNRADLHRANEVVQTLRVGVDGGRDWWRSENLAGAGIVCWLRGEFEAAAAYLEDAVRLATERGDHDFEAEWFAPFDPVVLDLTSLAQARWAVGDLAGADESLQRAVSRADQLEFPQGPFSRCYARYVEATISAEAGQYERTVKAAADLTELSTQHGFDQWVAVGALMHNVGLAVAALQAPTVDPEKLSGPIAMLTGWVDICRTLEAKGFLTTFDALLAKLLLATGQPSKARRRIDAALQLARETGMHYYDSELLRIRAQTHSDPEYQRSDLDAAVALARRKGASGFALRAALDDYALRGQPAMAALRDALNRMPATGSWPEIAVARAITDEAGEPGDQQTR